ncbi:hypothetical protein ABT090_20990 [Streptomyces asoensis]|uniref:hypothetical protein n=1 Tax=Streptomyces asoensis TaxID=249586 RepID=UPI00332B7B07
MTTQPDPQLVADVEEIYHGPTSFRDPAAPPAYGVALPVPQPGRPPMSQKAVDASTVMLSASVATIPPGAVAVGVMLASGYADPAVIGMICAAPAIVAVPIIAIARLLRAARPEPDVHHHYNGPVDQRTVHSSTRGVWARTENRQ